MRLKVPYLAAALVVGAVSSAVLAQPRPAARPAAPAARPGAPAARPAAPAARPGAPARPAPGRPVGPAAHVDGGAHADATAAATGDGGAAAAAMDGGADVTAAAVDTDAGTVTVNDASLPMRQMGSGTVLHFPVPEQFVRTAVPVFVQVRSSAPIDHVSLFFRGLGARRYTEVRMQAMGQQFRLASGYGAVIPCEDVFPPKAQYYVEAYDSSGEPNGRAGTADTPIEVSVVEQRHYPAPTLPGQPPPQTCGTLTVAATSRDAGVRDAEPERGSADLGEPCQVTNDCRRGLRCGSNHQCVFDR